MNPGTGQFAITIALVTFASFMPALSAGFVAWDDHYNFLGNPHYRGLGWAQVTWMVSTAWSGHWIPLTWLTLSLDWVVWGMNPLGYHLTSLLLHAANGALFFLVAIRLLPQAVPGTSGMGLRAAAAAAALAFAVHPLRAESVVWVTERRDVLSGLFYLLTLLAYLRAVEADPVRRRRWLVLSVAAFALAMLSKAIVVSLPLVLLVLDVYPLGRLAGGWRELSASRLRPLLLEKIPYAAVALAGAVAAVALATEFKDTAAYPLWARPAVFGYNLIFNLWKTLVPYGLSPLYELPATWDPRDVRLVLGLVVPIALTVGLVLVRRRWPAGLAVWAAYVVTLTPVGGLAVHTGPQIAADRYTYLAGLGVALLAGGAVCLVQRASGVGRLWRRPAAAAVLTVLAGLAVLAWQQSEIWHDDVALWRHAVAMDPGCARCQSGLGTALHAAGGSRAALIPLERAVALRPDMTDFHADLGLVLLWLERPADALPHLERAVRANPDNLDLLAYLGAALVHTGRLDEGQRRLQEVLQRRHEHVAALTTLGFALAESGRAPEAISYFERALARAPRAPAAHYGLARTYLAIDDRQRAERELNWLRAFDPALAERAQRR
jgi:cytochrome c-type biogenesis protein CcmH/NrfG